jgi:hypothetical protein
MDRSKIVAIVTGVIALLLSIAYLLVVQVLDLRGEMVPAPQDLSHQPVLEFPVLESPGAFGANIQMNHIG